MNDFKPSSLLLSMHKNFIGAAMSSTNHRDYSEWANFEFLRKLFTLSQSSPNFLSQYIPFHIELI